MYMVVYFNNWVTQGVYKLNLFATWYQPNCVKLIISVDCPICSIISNVLGILTLHITTPQVHHSIVLHIFKIFSFVLVFDVITWNLLIWMRMDDGFRLRFPCNKHHTLTHKTCSFIPIFNLSRTMTYLPRLYAIIQQIINNIDICTYFMKFRSLNRYITKPITHNDK